MPPRHSIPAALRPLLLSGIAAAALGASALPARALGPHEVLLIVNSNSVRSLEIANFFAKLRGVPTVNIVYLGLPDRVLEPAAELSPEEFTRHIWDPANRALDDRKIRDHILAWIYSADFPTRITHEPPISLQGLTLTRNVMPEAEAIRKGTYVSPLYAGPDRADGEKAPSQSLEQFTVRLGDKMPVPSMMLGVTGARGLSMDHIRRNLKYGLVSDGSRPTAPVYFIHTDDVRSKCRQWQVEGVQKELQDLHVRSVISTEYAAPPVEVAGLQVGRSWLEELTSTRFVPGAMAEHLTSFAGYFERPDQDVLSQWLRAGATASAGTVCEPLAIWTKFPHARFFTHYASGCTMLESFYQAIRCPLQILLVGDPLARPWAQYPAVTLVNLSDEDAPLAGKAEFLVTSWTGMNEGRAEYIFLIDGRVVPNSPESPEFAMDTTQLTDGYHELRAVAYARGTIRQQNFSTQGFLVENRGHHVELTGLPASGPVDINHPLALKPVASGTPLELAIVANERVLARAPFRPEQTLTIDPAALGPGPVALQAVALYKPREAVRSKPVLVEFAPLNQPPVIEAIERLNVGGGPLLRVKSHDPEGDPIHVDWVQDLALDGDAAVSVKSVDGSLVRDGEAWLLKAQVPLARFLLKAAWPADPGEFGATVSVPPESGLMRQQVAALLFNVQDPDTYDFFGLFGDDSAWVAGTCTHGQVTRVIRRGRFIEPSCFYRLSIRAEEGGLAGVVNDEVVLRWAGRALDSASFGLMSSPSTAVVKDVFVSPPLVHAALEPVGADLRIVDDGSPALSRIHARVRDGLAETRRPIGAAVAAPAAGP